jgi:hypothetical protein
MCKLYGEAEGNVGEISIEELLAQSRWHEALKVLWPLFLMNALVMYCCLKKVRGEVRWSRLRTAVFLFYSAFTHQQVRYLLLKGGDRIDDNDLDVFVKHKQSYFYWTVFVSTVSIFLVCLPLYIWLQSR